MGYNYIDNTGTTVPDTSTLLSDVTEEYKDSFGQDLITTPESPAGILINAEVEARTSVLQNNATLANQINPNLAGGVFLDAILALSGSSRNPPQFTTVMGILTGVPGTVVTAGFTAQVTGTTNNFVTTTTVTLDMAGSITVPFQCTQPGMIAVPIATLTTIISNVLGVETVNNTVAGIPGQLTQNDQSAQIFRQNTLFGQGSAMARAIIANVFKVANVLSIAYYENITSSPITIDGVVTVAPHSIYMCILGGIDLDVATAAQEKKQGGCGYSGSTTVNVTEPSSGQIIPVQFDRPTPIPVLVKVIISPNNSFIDPISTVQQAILDYANGLLPNQPGFVINADVSPFELAGAINIEAPSIFVQSVQVTLASSISYSFNVIPILINQIATLNVSGITVIIQDPP
jgi:hypothetical protein